MVTADLEGTVDNARMRQITGSHAAEMTKTLQGLVGKNALIQEGQGRWTRYRLPPSAGADSQQNGFHSQHKEGGSVHNGLGSVHNDGDSVHNGLGSVHNDGDSVHSGLGSVHNDGDSVHSGLGSVHNEDSAHGVFLTDDERSELNAIASAAKMKKRLPPQVLEGLILQLCKGRWLSRVQLAELLHRNPDSLRARFLTPMVQHGLLRLRHPDKPNRADQAYTAAGDAHKSAP